jgi:hypothetical protein
VVPPPATAPEKNNSPEKMVIGSVVHEIIERVERGIIFVEREVCWLNAERDGET